ncbi:Fused nickel transport protein NikMN [subsurface metagenome]
MHIPDGILPVPVTGAGYAATAVTTWYSIRRIKQKEDPRQDIPKASLLTAAFFVVSWIHIPMPPASVHLVLNGLLGALLGYYAFPAILIGLSFQAVMFGHGGLTTLGVNVMIMGLPAIAAHYIFRLRKFGNKESRRKAGAFGFLSSAVAMTMSVAMFVVILLTNLPADLDVEIERAAIYTLALAHVPLIFIEGTITALLVLFLQRVRPRILDGV